MKKAWFFTFSLSLVSVSFCDEVHEWGTFTTVSGSDGTVLPGLHVEEERLPAFVYSHEGVQYHASRYPQYLRESYAVNNSVGPIKGFPQTHRIENVTVKLETPVLYFYGDEKKEYNVKVGFNGGSISQWYPQRTSGDSLPKVPKFLTPEKQLKLDFSSPYEGAIEWDLTSIPKSESDHAFTFKPNQTLTWEYPRVAGANMLKVGEEYEDYLFYRGIGNFEQHVKFSVNQDDTLVIQNLSAEKIPFAFAFENQRWV